MRDQDLSYPDQKVIPFPHLSSRLLEKGVSAIKNKQYAEALHSFKQLYELEPDHPQASFGLSVCYVELGAYREAEELTEQMLKKDIGNYYDVLKLHISVLIQRQQYQKVIQMIEAVIEEGNVPSQMAMSLKQLEDFARKRFHESPMIIEGNRDANEENYQEESLDDHTFKLYLMDHDSDIQWRAIQNATAHLEMGKVNALKEFLVYEYGDPFLKSIVVRLLKEKASELQTLQINKYGQTFQVSLDDDTILSEENTLQVKQAMAKIEDENPTLFGMAIHIWDHFDIARFPMPIHDLPFSAWAAGCYCYTQELNGEEPDLNQVADDFNTSISDLQAAKDRISKIENASTHISK